jgi:hypothetical protein
MNDIGADRCEKARHKAASLRLASRFADVREAIVNAVMHDMCCTRGELNYRYCVPLPFTASATSGSDGHCRRTSLGSHAAGDGWKLTCATSTGRTDGANSDASRALVMGYVCVQPVASWQPVQAARNEPADG